MKDWFLEIGWKPLSSPSGRYSASALTLILALAAPPALSAQSREGSVDVGGVHVLTIRFPAGGMSVSERAEAVTERLQIILSDPDLKRSDLRADRIDGNNAKISVKGKLLVTVNGETARHNQHTVMSLARVWVRNLRRALPQLNVQPNPKLIESAPKPNPDK